MCGGQGREICEEREEAERPVSGSGWKVPFSWWRGGFSFTEAERGC